MQNMKQFAAQAKRVARKAGIACRNLPLTITGLGILTCIELFTAGGIIQSTPEVVDFFGVALSLAALEIGISYGCGILSFLGSGVVAELRADPRPEHRRRAGAARLASSALLVVPIVFFTNALALQTQKAAREQYVASEAYRAHQQMAADRSLDSVVRAQAAANLERASEVRTAQMDGTWFASLLAAIFVFSTLSWAGTALHRPRQETPWEAKERCHQMKLARQRARRQEAHKARMEELKATSKPKVFSLIEHLRAG